MNYLLDTCVISELATKTPNVKVCHWIDSLEDEQVFISVITIGELKRGMERLPKSARRQKLEQWLQSILVRFAQNILAINTELVLAWGALTAQLDRTGAPMPALDSLIAATAQYHHLTLATRNVADFGNAGIMLFDPWDQD